MFAGSGIRTHEAEARDLKTRPFDRSGIPAGLFATYIIIIIIISCCKLNSEHEV